MIYCLLLVPPLLPCHLGQVRPAVASSLLLELNYDTVTPYLPLKCRLVPLKIHQQRNCNRQGLNFFDCNGGEAMIVKSWYEGILRQYFTELLLCEGTDASPQIHVFGCLPGDKEREGYCWKMCRPRMMPISGQFSYQYIETMLAVLLVGP